MDDLDRWLESHAPLLYENFAEPIRDDALAETEVLIGRELPPDYVSFLRRHEGQRFVVDGDGGSLAPIFQAFELLATGYAQSEWRSMRLWGERGPGPIRAVGPVRPHYSHDAWWPFTVVHGATVHHCLDLDPPSNGNVGQVIVVAREEDRRCVIAPSFGAFVKRLAAFLETSVVGISAGGIELGDDALEWLLGSSESSADRRDFPR